MQTSSPARPTALLPHTFGSLIISLGFLAANLTQLGAAVAADSPTPPVTAAALGVTTKSLRGHIEALASDAFEGRLPGSPGEERTVDYLLRQFQALGLQPGNPDGTYLQAVPLVGFTAAPRIGFARPEGRWEPGFPKDCVVWSRHYEPEVRVTNSEVVFVGYGVVAPEYGWDDYKEVDVRGKTILMLVNDPQVPDPRDSQKLDDRFFKGRAMTYYGRWTYKYEIATAKGAAAALVIHETGPAGYPWAVVVGSNSRENFDLQTADRNRGRVPVEGWVTLESAQKLVRAAGRDWAALKQAAVRPDFRPVSLGSRADFTITNTLREVASRNVIARREGSDPKLKNEYVIYTAHWDHLGRNPKLEGDQIFNGAVDNASGTAGLLELARAFSHLQPKRTVLFLSVTAEEKGLLGAKYYAAHPLYPLAQTVANLNMDSLNVWGRTRDVSIVGHGQTTMEETVTALLGARGRVLIPEDEPEKGLFYRSDHFEFAKQGVPALYLKGGIDYLGRSAGYGRQIHEQYTQNDYHKVTDEIKPDWDLAGAVEDLELLLQVGNQLSQGGEWPRWQAGSEFRARREEMLRGAGARLTQP